MAYWTRQHQQDREDSRPAMAAILEAEGFTQLARDVLTETDSARLSRYAAWCVKNCADVAKQHKMAGHFAALGLTR